MEPGKDPGDKRQGPPPLIKRTGMRMRSCLFAHIHGMYRCDICGREMTHKIKSHGYVLCNKHYRQLKKYGEFKDDNPRTICDKNEYHICGDVTYIDLYDKDCNVIAQAIIDTEDLDKVKYTKWKLSPSGYAMNTPKFKGGDKRMSREILKTDKMVDHIDHDTLNNRKSNLRIVNKSQNQMNSNNAGISKRKDGKFYVHIKIDRKLINLGVYAFEEEALLARWYAEEILFGEYRYPKEKPEIPEYRDEQIKEYVKMKIQKYRG